MAQWQSARREMQGHGFVSSLYELMKYEYSNLNEGQLKKNVIIGYRNEL
jgi:hypothetical protein